MPDTARNRQVRRVLRVTLAANLVVVTAKLVAGVLSGALSVVAEAAHSSVDAVNNIVALVFARVAAAAPDEEHPYGHAKFETLGAVTIVAFLSITVYELVSSALRRLIEGTARPQVSAPLIAVVVGSAAVSLLVSGYEKRRARELRSELLAADAAHTRADVWASAAVLVGLAFVARGYARADAIFTLLVAAIIARAGWKILRRTVPVLVDERAVDPDAIRDIALANDAVRDVYSVRSRGRRSHVFAELTIAVDATLDVEQAHRIADDVERRVTKAIGAREVVVHVEPAHARQRVP